MDLYEEFQQQGHAPYYGTRSIWGDSEPVDYDFLRSLDGHGWHLDRTRFEQWLRRVAIARGATLEASARLESFKRNGDGWTVSLQTLKGGSQIDARFLIDASGRFAPVACRLGAQRRSEDNLICCWTRGQVHSESPAPGFTFVEAAEDGWWYTAPAPQRRRIVAFHTDSDLPAAHHARKALLDLIHTAPGLAALLHDCKFASDESVHVTRAGGATLAPCASDGWLAAGDAALSFDPLSAQGLFNALYTGLAAAEAADAFLNGDGSHLNDYAATLRNVYETYQRHRRFWYRQESRWPDSAFWRRRVFDPPSPQSRKIP